MNIGSTDLNVPARVRMPVLIICAALAYSDIDIRIDDPENILLIKTNAYL